MLSRFQSARDMDVSRRPKPPVPPLATEPPPRVHGRKCVTSNEQISSTCSAAPRRSGAAVWPPVTPDYSDGGTVPTTSSSCPLTRRFGGRDAKHDQAGYQRQRHLQTSTVFTNGEISNTSTSEGAVTVVEPRQEHDDHARVSNLRQRLEQRLRYHQPPVVACPSEQEAAYESSYYQVQARQQDIEQSGMPRPHRSSSEAGAPTRGHQAENEYVNQQPQPRPRERRASGGTRSAPVSPRCPRRPSERLPNQQSHHPTVKVNFPDRAYRMPIMETGGVPINSYKGSCTYCYSESPLLGGQNLTTPSHATVLSPTQGGGDVVRDTNIFISDVAGNAFTQHEVFTPRYRLESLGHRLEHSVEELKGILGPGIPADVTRPQYFSDAIHKIMSNWRDKNCDRGDANLKKTLIRYLIESKLTALINPTDLPPVDAERVESYLTSDVVSEELTVAKQATSCEEDSGFGSSERSENDYSYAATETPKNVRFK